MAKKSAPVTGITVFDVAQHAGVSIATVSRALNGNRPMSEDLRNRVVSSAEALGYQVNLVGRALRKKKTSTLGLIIPDLENPFFSSLAQHISRSFSASEVDVMVASADNETDQELRAVQSFLGRQVDSLVIIPTDERDSAASVKLASQYVPTIQFDRSVPGATAPYIGCDNAAGMRLVHEHLVESVDTDSQPVIFIGGGKSSSSGRERTSSFLGLRPKSAHFDGHFSFQWGQEAAQKILDAGYRKATIVTAADVIALGVISWLSAKRYRIPKDFRVIGFDDVGVAYLSHPELTTVRQPVEEMTQEIRALLSESDNSTRLGSASRVFAPSFAVRGSSPD